MPVGKRRKGARLLLWTSVKERVSRVNFPFSLINNNYSFPLSRRPGMRQALNI